ncbi:MAG: DUF3160 domain-containing protein [Myxococcota bacterium]|jgi:hypothetical protein|nr:DUF3160 domain-containing protein [Myxococcota bacterium]
MRGHYTRSEELKRYFGAMMWLGRTDLVLYDAEKPRPREEAAARALASAMQSGAAMSHFERLDSFYRAYVGRTNAITPVSLLALCEQAGLESCNGAADPMTAVYATQPEPDYSSRVTSKDSLPITMRFFPQRFAYDAWVTTRTTSPRLVSSIGEKYRPMASPMDVAFALGADRAIEYLADELTDPLNDTLPATLEAIRTTMNEVAPDELEDTIYNHWLEALRAASEPTLEESVPPVMRTAAWHDHKLETVMASWAEMRHDTILIVEQSTGDNGCQYPKGYVEPIPELFSALAAAVQRMQAVHSTGPFALARINDFFAHWTDVLSRLEAMAEKELAGQPFDVAELAFLNDMVDRHVDFYYGFRNYDGWYPSLFWTPDWTLSHVCTNPESQTFEFNTDHPSGLREPIVADVHTDAFNQLALEVGTGRMGLMVIAIEDAAGGLALYGGPVSSFYNLAVPVNERLTDEAWEKKLVSGDFPDRPAFAAPYWLEH